jgi:hypothetical protein
MVVAANKRRPTLLVDCGTGETKFLQYSVTYSGGKYRRRGSAAAAGGEAAALSPAAFAEAAAEAAEDDEDDEDDGVEVPLVALKEISLMTLPLSQYLTDGRVYEFVEQLERARGQVRAVSVRWREGVARHPLEHWSRVGH